MRRALGSVLAGVGACLLVLALPGVPARAAVLPCGAVLTVSVVIEANMDCTAQRGPALIVGADGITVDLGGHSVRSSAAEIGDRGAIYNDGHDNVTIQNGAASSDDKAVVLVNGADANNLSDLSGSTAGGAFIEISDSRGAVVEGISNAWTINGHVVVLIRTTHSTVRSVGTSDGISLIDSSDNLVAGNQIGYSDVGAVDISGASSRNQVRNNSIDGSWIYLSGSGNGNVVADNTIRRAYSGITIDEGLSNTTVSGNTVSDVDMAGIRVGVGATGTIVTGNTTRNVKAYSDEQYPSGSGIVVSNVNTTVTNNESYGNAGYGFYAGRPVANSSGNVAYSNGVSDCYNVQCSAPDSVAPTVSTRFPVVNATDVAVTANVTATFSEAVQAVSSTTVTLKDAAGAAVSAAVSYDSATRVATLNPNSDLGVGTTYTATLTGGTSAIRDLANNALVTRSWSFKTAAPADTTPPAVSSKSPAAGATGIAVGSNVVAAFSEAVQGVSATTFTLKNAAGTAVPTTVTYDATTRVATLDPGADLTAEAAYTATLTGGTTAIRDTANNALATGSWTFTTASATAPLVISEDFTSSAANFTRVAAGTWGVSSGRYVLTSPASTTAPNANLSVHNTGLAGDLTLTASGSTTATADTFNDFSVIFGYRDTSNYYYASFNETNDAGTNGIFRVAGGTRTELADFPSVITAGTMYPVKIERTGSAIKVYRSGTLLASATDATFTSGKIGFGTKNDGAAFDDLKVTGTAVADTTVPTVSSKSPAANATGVAVTANLTAKFSEAVQGVSGATFTLKNASGTAIAATVTYDATTGVATLNPSADLAADIKYTATLSGGATAIRDTANNSLATQSWTFLTGPAPTITARTPASGATAVSRTGNVSATFSEAVQAVSTSTFTLKNSAGTTITATITYNATTRVATLDPGSTLAAGTAYTARLTGGTAAIRDTAGNPLATASWTFTTGS